MRESVLTADAAGAQDASRPAVRAVAVRALTFGVLTFGVLMFGVLTFGVLTFGVLTVPGIEIASPIEYTPW
ncbi:hypothetical protein [Dietzia cercidiphylli]|uniref:hypothetical protein n=1 Tax=Dietzia cercidiphylli TaxID=498199 RepID=UPI00223C0C60|nr:hypothetical protein [Dietzia cercidiphylli]MCT1516744.1 hypothetical protein [Dietzia cercidiphylli]